MFRVGDDDDDDEVRTTAKKEQGRVGLGGGCGCMMFSGLVHQQSART